MKLSEFIEIYAKIQKKYSLPEFEEMNSSFDIGRIKRDSGNLVRDIRRGMVDKIIYYLKLIEVMINPSSASPIFLMLLKEITSEDKKVIDSVLSSFVGLEIAAHKLDISSTEKEEADLVLNIFGVWNEKKPELLRLMQILERNWKQTSVIKKNNRDYFN